MAQVEVLEMMKPRESARTYTRQSVAAEVYRLGLLKAMKCPIGQPETISSIEYCPLAIVHLKLMGFE